MKEDLRCLALSVFFVCLLKNIKLEVEWIRRSANDRANFPNRIVGNDNWKVKRDYFLMAEAKQGPHSVNQFANHENPQLPRFYTRFSYLGTEGVDAFSVPWAGSFLPSFLFLKSVITLPLMGLEAPLSFPHGLQPLFWPLIFTDEGLSPIISDVFENPMSTDV